ncbi:TolB family protein [Kitasatospora mediocidica]|uniref:TolB family protein n=1 Tax=Kitasatospora mediocidica TaxID=58352 RepID=UPI00068926A1|nr:PD40 domain-containing protein [Kitasatospora mediocidica]
MLGLGRARILTAAGVCAVTAALAAIAALPAVAAVPPAVVRVSLAPDGTQPDGGSYPVALSASGRYALFTSTAENLVPGGTNGFGGILVRDLWSKRVERIDVSDGGAPADSYSTAGGISADGRYVVFSSAADNLVPADTNGATDIFVRDLRTGRTERISTGDPALGPQTGDSFSPTISADGRYVAYASNRTDLVPGDTNQASDIFVFDRRTGTTVRADVTGAGAQTAFGSFQPAISADGSRVAFVSRDSSLLPAGPGAVRSPLAIHKPRFYPLYVHDLRTGTTSLASVAADGSAALVGGASLSPDGRYAVFTSFGDDIPAPTQVLVRDLDRGTTTVVSTAPDGTPGDASSHEIGMTADDRWAYFASDAGNLLPGGTGQSVGFFRRDLRTGTTQRVTPTAPGGAAVPLDEGEQAIDALGTTLLFAAGDSALVPGDTNQQEDVFAARLSLR